MGAFRRYQLRFPRIKRPLNVICRPFSNRSKKRILVVGSANVDSTIHLDRIPKIGETLTASIPEITYIAGGKGNNQAIAVSRLLDQKDSEQCLFVASLGVDSHADLVEQQLSQEYVDASGLRRSPNNLPTGQGIVNLLPDGNVTSVVIPGANSDWDPNFDIDKCLEAIPISMDDVDLVMLQQEIPEIINIRTAKKAKENGVCVILDAGGEDRKISGELLSNVTFLMPNKTELRRLVGDDSLEGDVIAGAKVLLDKGVKNVVVTLGEEGSVFVNNDEYITLKASHLPINSMAVDETGAGDAFRAAFAVKYIENPNDVESALKYASSAGALAVTKIGAVSSLPYRSEVDSHMKDTISRSEDDRFPFKFSSRLNSMKDRTDLWNGSVDSLSDTLNLVKRQSQAKSLDYVDFNYPQHLKDHEPSQVREVLDLVGMKAGAICLRFEKKFRKGAFTNPDENIRREAIATTLEAGEWAEKLGCKHVIVWSAFCGYDYSLQSDFQMAWDLLVYSFREICDAFPNLKISLEFKPTDENTRWFIAPSTGAALLITEEVNRENMGLCIDFGHCLMAGENPAQSIALVGSKKKLFAVQLNDGYQRLGAEDGLMFGSVHPAMALEFCLWLRRVNYDGHIYFDTFPRNEDPVKEAEKNIETFKRYWELAGKIENSEELSKIQRNHDALGSLELLRKLRLC